MSNFTLDTESLKDFVPKYLTPDEQKNLIETVREHFPFSTDPEKIYVFSLEKDKYYQGDSIIDVPFPIFKDNAFEINFTNGILASNTCDINPENTRLEPINFQFCNIIPLIPFINQIRSKFSSDKIESFLSSLKRNDFSNLFYLPEYRIDNEVIVDECFVSFDKTSSLPPSIFELPYYKPDYRKNDQKNGDRIFSLSDYGFYLFIIKMSVHYCRFRENVHRA